MTERSTLLMQGGFLFLAGAILFEVLATSFLRMTDGFTRPLPSIVVVLGYGLSFYLLSLALRSIAVGPAYAIWSGFGIVLVTIAGWFLYQQSMDWPAILGLSMIVGGVVVINTLSQTVALG